MNIYTEEIVKAIRGAETEERAAEIFTLAVELHFRCDTSNWITMSLADWLSTGDMDGGFYIVCDQPFDQTIEAFLRTRIREALQQNETVTDIRGGVLYVLEQHLKHAEEYYCSCHEPREDCVDCTDYHRRTVAETKAAIDAAKTLKFEASYRTILSPVRGTFHFNRAVQIQVGDREPIWVQTHESREGEVELSEIDLYEKLRSLVNHEAA